MRLIEVIATSEGAFDMKTNTLTYSTEIEAGPGVLLNADKTGDKDLIIINQVHGGGKVSVTMKPYRIPTRRYAPGEVVAVLMTNEQV